jgi:hypothetical protein
VDPSSITPQQKMLAGAVANVLFIISLFFDWVGSGPFGFSGWDIVPSAWIFLIFAAIAAVLLAAAGTGYDIGPVRVPPVAAALFLSSVCFVISLAIVLEGDTKFGAFLGLLFSAAATVLAFLAFRDEQA